MNATISHEIVSFPQPSMSLEALFKYYQKEFRFSPKEVATIMGAHNLGGASIGNAGYQGTWKPGYKNGVNLALTMNNDYYGIMIDPNIQWENIDASAKYGYNNLSKWQWEGLPKNSQNESFVYMMFNTDFYTFFNITVDSNGKATCRLDTACGHQGTCGLLGECRTFSMTF